MNIQNDQIIELMVYYAWKSEEFYDESMTVALVKKCARLRLMVLSLM